MILTVIHHYLIWHYSRAYIEFFTVWTNLLWFVVHFFSMAQLLRTLFAPWKRITEERTKSWDLQDWAGTILINLLSRLIGAIMRLFVIFAGVLSLSITATLGALVYLTWFVAPIIIAGLFIMGVIIITL